MSGPCVGVLSLQGAFLKHQESLDRLGVRHIQVRTPEQLASCDALIIPGGESTTMFKQLAFAGLEAPLRVFAQEKPVFGTCAGLILMASSVVSTTMSPFGLIDISVERNAYGRQTESFATNLPARLEGKERFVHAVFIRAPQIVRCGPEVEILAEWEGIPVLVRQGRHLASAFHPELTLDSSIHEYFLHSFSREKALLSSSCKFKLPEQLQADGSAHLILR